MASPEAAASPWVGKEIAYWLEHKSVETVLIALTDGTLVWDGASNDFAWSAAAPLPTVLKGAFGGNEPKWVDLTAYRIKAAPGDSRFEELAADFAAVIRGIPKEDLLSEEVRQQRRYRRHVAAAALVLFVATGIAGWQWRQASFQRDRAETALAAATDT